MTIDTAVSLDRIKSNVDTSLDGATRPAAAVGPDSAAQSGAEPASAGQIVAAMQQLQGAISSGPNPDFTLDYLSGLSVVTVRSMLTGEVVFQLPDTRVLELARLLGDGASLNSLGLLDIQA